MRIVDSLTGIELDMLLTRRDNVCTGCNGRGYNTFSTPDDHARYNEEIDALLEFMDEADVDQYWPDDPVLAESGRFDCSTCKGSGIVLGNGNTVYTMRLQLAHSITTLPSDLFT